jgi:two-component system response regulator RegX3
VGTAKLVLVEDDDDIVRPLLAALVREGFTVERLVTAEEGLAAIPEFHPDLVILDIGLPGMSGLDACKVIRERWGLPIIMLTARGDTLDRVLALELGADDYVAKPFSARELMARIRAVLRRVGWRDASPHVISVGELQVDTGRREVRVSGVNTTALTPREFDLLAYLAARSPAVVSRSEIMSRVWDTHWDGPTQTLDVHVAQVRSKIEPDPRRPRFLHTARGVGYQVKDECAAA